MNFFFCRKHLGWVAIQIIAGFGHFEDSPLRLYSPQGLVPHPLIVDAAQRALLIAVSKRGYLMSR